MNVDDVRQLIAQGGLRPPVFAEEHHQFIITLYGPAAEGGVTTPASNEAIHRGLNKRQTRALAYLKEYGQITRSEYSTLTGVQKTEAYRELRDMAEKGLIVPRGRGRNIHYIPVSPIQADQGTNGER